MPRNYRRISNSEKLRRVQAAVSGFDASNVLAARGDLERQRTRILKKAGSLFSNGANVTLGRKEVLDLRRAMVELLILNRGDIREVMRLTGLNKDSAIKTFRGTLRIPLRQIQNFIVVEETLEAAKREIPNIDFSDIDYRNKLYERIGKLLGIEAISVAGRIRELKLGRIIDAKIKNWERNRLIVMHARTKGVREKTYRRLYGSRYTLMSRKLTQHPGLEKTFSWLENAFREEERRHRESEEGRAKNNTETVRRRRQRIADQLKAINDRLDIEASYPKLDKVFTNRRANLDGAIDLFLSEKNVRLSQQLPREYKPQQAVAEELKRKIIKCSVAKIRTSIEMAKVLGINIDDYTLLLRDLGLSGSALMAHRQRVQTLEAFRQAFYEVNDWRNNWSKEWRQIAATQLGSTLNTVKKRIREGKLLGELNAMKARLMI